MFYGCKAELRLSHLSSSKVSMSLKFTVVLWPGHLTPQGKERRGIGHETCEEEAFKEAARELDRETGARPWFLLFSVRWL